MVCHCHIQYIIVSGIVISGLDMIQLQNQRFIAFHETAFNNILRGITPKQA